MADVRSNDLSVSVCDIFLSCVIEFYARRNKSRIYFYISAFVSLIPLFLLLFYYDQNQILKYFILTVFALNAISSLYKFFASVEFMSS